LCFLKEEDVSQVEGLKLLTHEQGLALERRGEPRYALNNPKLLCVRVFGC
jgi:hypothetical protein